MTKIKNFNSNNEKWSQDIIKNNSKWIISKENMKWKYQMHNKNYAWLYRVLFYERSNEFTQELKLKESVYFRDLLIFKEKTVLSVAERIKNSDEEKTKMTRLMNITPYFWGFRWGQFLNDNRTVFNSVLTNKGKENLREYYINLLGENYKNHSLYNLLNVNTKSGVGYNIKQMGLKQITDEKYGNIISRKMENRLSTPHYFFSNRYISRSNILPQIRNWHNTIYSFIKPTIVNIKYIDLITTEFLKVFFNPKLLKRKVVKGNFSEWKVFAGMSIASMKIFNKYMNELVRFTSQRSQEDIKNVFNYSSNILSLPWVRNELAWAKTFRKIFKSRRDRFEKGYNPKRGVLFSKKRNIWLSKPLFRHTASNVIIDLYLFNNKSFKLTKYHHMMKVRAIYKYMYSMYANYDQIIQGIISRPRIFYINIIDPKMHEYYSRIIRSYENALIHFSKSQFMYFLLDLLKWNLNNKIFGYLSSTWAGFKFNSNLNFFNSKGSDNNEFRLINNDYNKSNRSLSLITAYPTSFNEGCGILAPLRSTGPDTGTQRVPASNNNNYKFENLSSEYNEEMNSSSAFGIWVTEKSNNRIQKYIPLSWNNTSNNVNHYIFRSLSLKSKISKYRSIYNNEKKNILINDYITLINNDVYKIKNKKVRNLSWWKNEYYLLKELGPRYNAKAMAKLSDEELERNALTPLIYKDYPRWSKELIRNSKLKNKNKERYTKRARKVKIFGKDKFSLSNYKWHLKKGKKWKTLTPKFWEEQMEKYNSFGKAQKSDDNPNQKWVYDSKTKLKVHISKFQADNSIFDKINKKRKLKNKIKLKLKSKLGKKNFKSKNSDYKVITNQINKGINQSKFMNKTDSITKLNQYERIDKNSPKIDTRPLSSNMPAKLNQGPIVTKQSKTGSSKSNNYKGKPYNKNKDAKNYEYKTDQFNKFGYDNSNSKFDNKKNIKFKDKDNINRKNNNRSDKYDSKSHNIPLSDFKEKGKNYSDKNNSVNNWRPNEALDSFFDSKGKIKNYRDDSWLCGSKSKFGNKRKIHTLRSVSKVENKYVKPKTNSIPNNCTKKDKFIMKKSKSILLGLLGLLSKLSTGRLSNDDLNALLLNSQAHGYKNVWNLLNKNWNLSEYVNLSLSKGNDIKSNISHRRNYIKFIKDNYKNDKQAKYKKIDIMVKVLNKLENRYTRIDLDSVLDLKNKIKWDKFDESIIRMILMLIMSSKKRVYNKNIETYLKMKWKDIGRGRPKSKRYTKIKNKSNLNKARWANISKRNKKLNKKIGTELNNFLGFSFERLVGTIRNKFINNDRLYIDIISKEFYIINRDVIISKTTENYNNESNTLGIPNSYEFGYYTNNINTRFTMAWNEVNQFSLKLWQTLNLNKREENLMHILSFSDKAFKPYYRYIIRLFMLGEYRKFISRLGFKSIILHLNLPFHFGNGGAGTKFSWIKDNSLKIFNFIAVKTLFNLFKFNHRSLYILKPKFYHINKFRLYRRKAKRLNFNTWLRSIRYLKSLRKAPNSYWLRYHKLVNIYYQRIINYAKWDTERKVLMPYVLYFEDLLYNIYGKLALVRIWPLKRYFLSIYILTERLMLLLDKNAHRKKRRQNLKHLFTRFVLNFLNLINKTKIDRIYESNLSSNSRWPTELITEVNKDLPLASDFNKLEYFSKKLDLAYHLNSYVLKYSQLDNFIDIPEFDYPKIAKDQYIKIRDSKINTIKQGLNLRFKKGFMQYWGRPIKNMLLDINFTQDIRGFLFKLAGKAKGVQRKFNIWHQRGSFLGARHYNKLTYRYITISSMHVRNSVRPTMEHHHISATFPAGATNLKVWYSSLLSSDVMELIFYLLKKKVVFDALMNRNFFVHKNVEYFLDYNKWTKDKTISLLNELSYLNYREERGLNKYSKPNKKSRHLHFGIAVKNRFIWYIKGNRFNKMSLVNSHFPLKKGLRCVK
jgi:hypothetical protein